jgi:DNA-binding SARP family transcriptional activator
MSVDWGTQTRDDLAVAAAPVVARASLFGEFALIGPSGLPIVVANRRARALLAILSLEPDSPMTREDVTKLLWPGRFEAQARASLRQCLL